MGSRALAACQGEDMILCSSWVKSSFVLASERRWFVAACADGVTGVGAEDEGATCIIGTEGMID